MKKVPFHIPSIGKKELDALKAVVEDNWLTEGKRVRDFEDLFIAYSGGRHSRAVSSCTAALHISNILSGSYRQKKVLVPVYTFAATLNSILYTQAEPVFVDSSDHSPNIGIKELSSIEVNDSFAALMIVNIGGIPCELSRICDFAKANKLKLIQDNSHSIESSYKGMPLGDYGDFICYSFHTTKNMTTSDGGMLVYNDSSYAEEIDQLIHHGMDSHGTRRYHSSKPWDYNVVRLGYKYNMTDLQAAIGISQLLKLRENYSKRESLYRLYLELLREIPAITLPGTPEGARASYHLFQIFLNSDKNPDIRDMVLNKMFEKGIVCSVHFKPLHIQPFYQKLFNLKADDFPNSIKFYNSAISLPIFPMLTEEKVFFICDTLKKIIKDHQI